MLRTGRLWAAGLALAALMVSSQATTAADAKYFPGNTEIVITTNFRQILDSEFLKANPKVLNFVKDQIKEKLGPGAEKFLQDAGFDLYKDLTSLTIAGPPTKDSDAFLVIIEGNFNPDKITKTAEDAAKAQGDLVKITKAGKFRVFEITAPGEKRIYAALLNNKTMAVCSAEENMKGVLGRAAGTKKSTLKKEISSLLKATSAKQSLSFVATGSALAKLAAEAPNVNEKLDALKSVEGLSGAVTIAKDLQLHLGVVTKDAATAKEFANKANTGIQFVRFLVAGLAQDDAKLQPLADAVKTLQATAQGSNLILRGNISADNLKKLIDSFQP